jgi:release factor glutamine methyltransferase
VRETLGAILAEAAAALSKAGLDESRRRARRLVAESLGLSPAALLSRPRQGLEPGEADRVRRMLGRMIAGEPISRILGRREFWGLNFALSADTLDPRPESETVVEAVLARFADRGAPFDFLDLGTGTGCLLLALLAEFPAAAGVGADISAGAVSTARSNAAALGLADRARFFVGDWASALSGRFAAIVANPPYIAEMALADLPPEVRCYDPQRALNGGVDGLVAYRMIAADLPALLMPDGVLAVEVGAGQGAAAAAIFEARGLMIDGIEHDLAGVERCVVLRPVKSDRVQAFSGGQKNLGMCRCPV